MALTDRQNDLLEYLKQHRHAKIAELARLFYVSEATVRRDITQLKKMGLLERIHGGAVALDTANEVAISVRYDLARGEKREVADIAKNRLPEFKTVFIDNSSTALILAQMINLQYKTVVTNGLMLATELSKRENINVLLPGGNLFVNTNSLVGSVTLRALSDLHFDLMICSCAAADETGVYENSLEQSEIKRLVRKNSACAILLVDKTKLGVTATYRTCTMQDFELVFTNADDSTVEAYRLPKTNIFNKRSPATPKLSDRQTPE